MIIGKKYHLIFFYYNKTKYITWSLTVFIEQVVTALHALLNSILTTINEIILLLVSYFRDKKQELRGFKCLVYNDGARKWRSQDLSQVQQALHLQASSLGSCVVRYYFHLCVRVISVESR